MFETEFEALFLAASETTMNDGGSLRSASLLVSGQTFVVYYNGEVGEETWAKLIALPELAKVRVKVRISQEGFKTKCRLLALGPVAGAKAA
jgi:hypothetical protein